jgi:hypothetical protein
MSVEITEEGDESADIDFGGESAKMSAMDMDYYEPSYYMPQWVQAIIGVLVLAVVLLFQVHTIHVMFKYFTLTPI